MSNFTSTSGVFVHDDGSVGIGVECFFDQANPTATQTWNLDFPVTAMELWGGVAMRTSGDQADILLSISLVSPHHDRQIWGDILKAGGSEPDVNKEIHQDPIALVEPATQLRVDMQAAGSGNAWSPLNCEIRFYGRYQ